MTMAVGRFGATGSVGREIVKVLGNRKFPLGKLELFASVGNVTAG